MGNKAATFSFLDKVFWRAHSPPRRGGVSATSKKWIRSDLSRTGWSVRRPFERPAELTTITASRYRARASRPSAPPLWLRGIFLMAQPPLLCEEGNMTHSSSVQTATSLTFGCGAAALSLFVANFFARFGRTLRACQAFQEDQVPGRNCFPIATESYRLCVKGGRDLYA